LGPSTAELRKWRDIQGLMFLQDYQAQIVLRDYGEPIFLLFARPAALVKDGPCVIGTFKITAPGDGYATFLSGPYYKCLQAFSISLKHEDYEFLLAHPEMAKYFTVEERDRIRAVLEKYEEKEPWLSEKRPDSYSASRLSGRISGTVAEAFLRPGSRPR
jgi:hypothetical protein